jgi:hypothetical protein
VKVRQGLPPLVTGLGAYSKFPANFCKRLFPVPASENKLFLFVHFIGLLPAHCPILLCLDVALILPESVTDVSGHAV